MKTRLFCIAFTLLITVVSGKESDQKVVTNFIEKWNALHNEKNFIQLEQLYEPGLYYYGQWLSRREVIRRKKNLLKAIADYRQQTISTTIQVELLDNGTLKCYFNKQVHVDSANKTFPAYLILQTKNATYSIVGESDQLTDGKIDFASDKETEVTTLVQLKNYIQTTTASFPVYSPIAATASVVAGLLLFVGIRVRKKIKARRASLVVTPVHEFIRNSDRVIPMQSLNTSHAIASQLKSNRAIELPITEISVKRNETSEEKGTAFEGYVVKKIKDNRYMKLLEWRGDKYINGIYPPSNLDPDLHYRFEYNEVIKEFVIECKFRSNLFKGLYSIEQEHIDRYEQFSVRTGLDVYLFLGLGGLPTNPNELFLVPLSAASRPLTSRTLASFKINPKHLIFMFTETMELGTVDAKTNVVK